MATQAEVIDKIYYSDMSLTELARLGRIVPLHVLTTVEAAIAAAKAAEEEYPLDKKGPYKAFCYNALSKDSGLDFRNVAYSALAQEVIADLDDLTALEVAALERTIGKTMMRKIEAGQNYGHSRDDIRAFKRFAYEILSSYAIFIGIMLGYYGAEENWPLP